MPDPTILDQLAEKLAAAVPPGMRELQQDLEKNFRAILQSTFARLDLVTREEFDVQSAVLARTREKLEQLEAQVRALEARLADTAPAGPES
ncbi:MAG TPA: accessory factor UbiK family protein [Gammaproteobacteria bacterium]|nr:accessory factor UbiK family protein [Gammaproteobacteria bacterium]